MVGVENISDVNMDRGTCERVDILGVGVSAVELDSAVDVVMQAARRRDQCYVCVTGAHGIIESQDDGTLRQIHNRSLLTVPDGMPNVWIARLQGFSDVGRVYGPDLMARICATDNISHDAPNRDQRKLRHFLFGSTEQKLRLLKSELERRYPGIAIVGTYAPPFRALSASEELELRQTVAQCHPDIFWVGLSTPKQERFMASHSAGAGDLCLEPLDAGVMIGVGAAFDILAGEARDAPAWIKNAGLQWLFRLCCEPRRLLRRYLAIVPAFIWLNFLQLMGIRHWDKG